MENLEDKPTTDGTDMNPTQVAPKRKNGTGIYLLICVAAAVIVYILLPDKPNPWRGIRENKPEAALHTIEGLAQGSFYRVSYYDDVTKDSAAEAGNRLETALRHSLDSLLHTFDLRFSLWEENSLLCRVNRNEDPELDAMFIDLFEKSMTVSRQTEGAFDITVAPLVKAYGFAKDTVPGHRMSAGGRDSLLARVGHGKAALQGNRLVKRHPGLQLDFNAIAQGYCADLVAGFLEGRGLHRYLVDIGGEMRLKGRKNDGAPWQIAIERPADHATADRRIYHTVPLTDAAIVTSGNYRKYFEEDGHRFSHTIDPKTGEPVRDSLLSATVVCAHAWEADAMATAFMVMGLEGTRRYLDAHPGRYKVFLIYARSEGADKQADASDGFGFWSNGLE